MSTKGIQRIAADAIGEVPSIGMGSSVWEYLCPQPALLCQCSAFPLGHVALIIFCIVPILSPLTALPDESQHQLLAPLQTGDFCYPLSSVLVPEINFPRLPLMLQLY